MTGTKTVIHPNWPPPKKKKKNHSTGAILLAVFLKLWVTGHPDLVRDIHESDVCMKFRRNLMVK